MLRRFLAAEGLLRYERELTDIERKRRLAAELHDVLSNGT
jgi:hypothetical protein